MLRRIFAYLSLRLGVAMGVLGVIGLFIAMQQVVDYVLTAQEVWFAAVVIVLMVVSSRTAKAAEWIA